MRQACGDSLGRDPFHRFGAEPAPGDVLLPGGPPPDVSWRDEPGFFYTWLALAALLTAARLALEFRLRDPFLEAVYYLSIMLYLPPVFATLASLSGPLRGESLAAFTLGIYTYSASPVPGAPLGLLACLARRCGSLSWPTYP